MIEDLKINEAQKQLYYEKGWWRDQTIADVWEEQWPKYADDVYVNDELGRSLTYGEVNEGASRLAAWFKEVGVQNGDVVSFQVPKWVESAIIYVACLKVGAVMHPVATNLNAMDVEFIINQVKPVVFICPTFFHNTDYEMQYDMFRETTKSLRAVMLIDREYPAHNASIPTFDNVIKTYKALREPAPSRPDEVACILTTSGTTGKPKASMLTHNNLLFCERVYVEAAELTHKDVVWMPSPLNHATGFCHGLIATMTVGGRTVLQLNYNAKGAVELINNEGCTWSHGATPFIFDILRYLDETGLEIPSMRLYNCGGAPVPSQLVKWADKHGVILSESYGATESFPHLYVPPEKCLEWDGQFSGIPYEGIEVRVVDKQRNEVPRGSIGEEASRGPNVFVGYLNQKDQTDKLLDDDGWYYSGDLCTMDEQGRIHIVGRIKDIIIRGGENISMREVDESVLGWDQVCDLATVGMPDERLGERICLFAVRSPKADHPLELCELLAYLENKGVAKRLWPERVEEIDVIPRTPTGKVKRFVLSKEIAQRMENEE